MDNESYSAAGVETQWQTASQSQWLDDAGLHWQESTQRMQPEKNHPTHPLSQNAPPFFSQTTSAKQVPATPKPYCQQHTYSSHSRPPELYSQCPNISKSSADGSNSSMAESQMTSNRKTPAQRRMWTAPEEEELILGLKECVANGYRADNGFRTGHLAFLENYMNNRFPGTDLKADPHINNKIHVWKKNHASLSTMMSMSGFGWNERTCQIMVEDQVWDAYVKIDTNAKSMRKKCWPYYKEWAQIFGKDRATGSYTTTVGDALNDLCAKSNGKAPVFSGFNAANSQSAPQQSGADSTVRSRGGETIPDPIQYPPSNKSPAPTKSPAAYKDPSPNKATSPIKSGGRGKKRSRLYEGAESDMVNLMGKFFNEISSHMGEIKENLGTEREAIEMRRKVIDAITPLPNLSTRDKLLVVGKICEKPKDVDIFLRVDDEMKSVLAQMIKDHQY